MANCYGTKQYENFKREQLALGNDGKWKLKEIRTQKYNDYELKYVTYSSSVRTNDNFVYDYGELTVSLSGKTIYACTDIYESHPTFFYFFTLGGCDFLMFRKDDLYGYVILNLKTQEEHNYFPDVVLNGEESFIIVEATLWNDILLLYGCYWAGPCIYFLLDANTYKTYRLGIRDTDNAQTIINKDTLTITHDDGDKPETETFTYAALAKLLDDSETYDI